MATEEELELLNAEIDGALDEQQRARLSRALLKDPALRARRTELLQLAAALDSLAVVEPPAGLTGAVLAALPQSTRTAGSWWASPSWRHAAVIASVVAAGAIVYAIVSGQDPRATDVAGTFAAPGAAAILDTARLGGGPVSGQVNLYRNTAGLALTFDVSASAPVDVRVTRDGHTLELSKLGAGERRTLALPGPASSGTAVALSFVMAGREVASATLHVPEDR